ncbi:lysophospholipid acyltransferase family protein [Vibrio sp. S4M6]|uniref:lysophospholipid acyltransferase family protein n=1 Tax=Vibrio sinus TaxID=2946865 RepID=UPI002029B705|nr:lysophospholipid acyltransferase family protein [Vibrio sinus]MCL9780954.1 lysophospholipid acyltransferase family protein [Vibrio sinus]
MTSPFRLPRKTPFGIGENIAEWAIGLSKLDKFYAERPLGCTTSSFLRYTLETLGIQYKVTHGELTGVPTHGSTLVVANHPLGCVEGVILAELLLMIRPDVKVLANHYLKNIPELDELFIGVDVFEGQQANTANRNAYRQARDHLNQGGLLLIFPAGEVSQMVDRKTQRLEDKEWSRSVSAFIKSSKATTVPVFIQGANSKSFYMAGKVHPFLRTLMLGRELLNKHQQNINISIGEPIKYKELHRIKDGQIVSYVRLNTYLLNPSHQTKRNPSPCHQIESPLAPALSLASLLDDIENIPTKHHLLSSGEFDVYCTTSEHIPAILHEIGRLREENFRAVGEGTGRSLDIDDFDQHYRHLFVWDRDNQCLVGAYRLGMVDQILDNHGLDGLYSTTLFNYDHHFLHKMGKAIELGRSVIAAAYQKSMSALLLLWKGIGRVIVQNPQYTHLFGPVSISNDYSEQARQLLADTMTLHYYDTDSASYVEASNPLHSSPPVWNTSLLTALGDLQLLSKVIARMDNGKGVPVLLRQYLSMNGKLVCFNVDPEFNGALDGLIMVDLRNVPLKTLGRYMEQEPARQYLGSHQC